MSELAVGSLKGLAANGFVIDIAAGSTLNVPPPAILQVVQTVKTNIFSQSLAVGAFTDEIPGLQATITPSSVDSKILVFVNMGNRFATAGAKLLRNGTDVTAYLGDANSGLQRASSDTLTPMLFLDSPASTSAQTYGVKAHNSDTVTQTVKINQELVIVNRRANTASTITLMEVAG